MSLCERINHDQSLKIKSKLINPTLNRSIKLIRKQIIDFKKNQKSLNHINLETKNQCALPEPDEKGVRGHPSLCGDGRRSSCLPLDPLGGCCWRRGGVLNLDRQVQRRARGAPVGDRCVALPLFFLRQEGRILLLKPLSLAPCRAGERDGRGHQAFTDTTRWPPLYPHAMDAKIPILAPRPAATASSRQAQTAGSSSSLASSTLSWMPQTSSSRSSSTSVLQ